MKLKSLPSLREKKRYVFFRVHSNKPVQYNHVRDAVNNSLINWLGDKDFASSKTRLIRNLWDPRDNSGVIRCSHKSVDDIKISLALVHQIGDNRVIFQTLRVSGTIKSGKEKIEEKK